MILLPSNCTDRLQPMDLSVNKSAKDFLQKGLVLGIQSRYVLGFKEKVRNL